MSDLETFRCPTCERALEPTEIRLVSAGSASVRVCARCGEPAVIERSRVVQPTHLVLAAAYLYPFRPVTLLISAIALFAAFGAERLVFIGGLVAAGIRVGWLFAILRASSFGKDDPEVEPGDVGPSFITWMRPFSRSVAATLVAFAPALAARYAFEPGPLVTALALVGALYLPAAMIVAAHDSSGWAVVNPLAPIRLIAQIPKAYATACGMLLVLLALAWGVSAVAESIEGIIGEILGAVVAYLPLVAAARMLGLLVYEHREEL